MYVIQISTTGNLSMDLHVYNSVKESVYESTCIYVIQISTTGNQSTDLHVYNSIKYDWESVYESTCI